MKFVQRGCRPSLCNQLVGYFCSILRVAYDTSYGNLTSFESKGVLRVFKVGGSLSVNDCHATCSLVGRNSIFEVKL